MHRSKHVVASLHFSQTRDPMSLLNMEAHACMHAEIHSLQASMLRTLLLQEAITALEQASRSAGSQVLQSLVTPGERFPDMQQPLQQLTNATDWEAAYDSGQIVPTAVRPPWGQQIVLMSTHTRIALV